MKYLLSAMLLCFSVSSFSEIITIDTGSDCGRKIVKFKGVIGYREEEREVDLYIDICKVTGVVDNTNLSNRPNAWIITGGGGGLMYEKEKDRLLTMLPLYDPDNEE